MGVCSRESSPGLWSPEVGCFSNNCIALPDTTALMPNNKSPSALMLPVSVWTSNVVYHNVLAFIAETWHSRILNHGVWSHLAVCVPGCALQGCVLPRSAGWSSGASMSISSLWLSVMRNLNGKLKVMEIGLFLVARVPALAGDCQHRSPPVQEPTEWKLGCSPGQQWVLELRGLGGSGGLWPTAVGMWASSGDKRHLNCSSLQVDVIRIGGSFGPARWGFGVLASLLPKPFCTTYPLPCCIHVVSTKTFLEVWILFCLWHQIEMVHLHPLKSVSEIQRQRIWLHWLWPLPGSS